MRNIRKKALVADAAAFTQLEIRLLGAAVITAAAVSLVVSLVADSPGSGSLAALGGSASPAAMAAGR